MNEPLIYGFVVIAIIIIGILLARFLASRNAGGHSGGGYPNVFSKNKNTSPGDEAFEFEGYGESWYLGTPRKSTNNNLQIASSVFVIVLLILLVLLGNWGWGGVQKSIDFKLSSTPIPSVTPAVTGSATPAATETASATPTPVGTPASEWTKNKDLLGMAAAQHYAKLVTIAGMLTLIPAFLLVAFAFQRVPRLTKDLEKDLIKLAILKPQLDLAKQQARLEKELKRLAPKLSKDSTEDLASELINNFWLSEDEMQQKARDEGVPVKKLNELMNIILEIQSGPNEDSRERFEELLAGRFGWVEYILPLTPLTLFLLACFAWIFWPSGIPDFVNGAENFNQYIGSKIITIMPALAGVVTAYVFLIYQLVRRNNGSDLTPGAFWEAIRRLLAVFGLGLILTAFQQNDLAITAVVLILIAVFIGIFPIGALSTFARGGQVLVQTWLEKQIQNISADVKFHVGPDLSQRLSSRHELYLLDDLDEWDAIRLEEANVIGIQGMATADMEHLVTWTPFPTSQVVDWVDQSMLYMASGAEPETSYAKTFRTIGLRKASALIEMAKDDKGKQTIVLAAKAVQTSGVFDPLPVAQLAAVRAQWKIKEMQDKVSKVKDKKKDDNLDASLKSEVESAVSLVHNAKSLVDQAHEQVKAGGELLKNALSLQADPLKAMLEAAEKKVKEAETELKAITDSKVSEKLANALKALGDKVAGDPDANKRATELVQELDRVANPMNEILSKAIDFQAKCEAVLKAAENKADAVPTSVAEAATLLEDLTKSAKEAQERVKKDTSLEDALNEADELVKELEADGEDKAVKLFGDTKLKSKDQWAEGKGKKAKCYADVEKLVKHAQDIVAKAEKAEKVIRETRAEKAASGAALPLTCEVLETILAGLTGNANLQRIQHYIEAERDSVTVT